MTYAAFPHEDSELVLHQVSRRFGGLQAVDGVSLRVEPGEALALVGPNGAGKSTLIQLISGFVRPDAGRISLGEHRLDGMAASRIAMLGVRRTFQTSRVFPALSVRESVQLGQRGAGLLRDLRQALFGVRRPAAAGQAVDRVLALFGDRLRSRADEPAFSLSYANRRRVEIARCLLAEPRFLLLDEPTAGMNPSETAELTDLLLELRRQRPGIGLLIVEHKLDVVRRLADRVLVLSQGRTLVEGSADEVFAHPAVVEAYLGRRRGERAMRDAHHG